MRFSIRVLMFVTVIVALALGWRTPGTRIVAASDTGDARLKVEDWLDQRPRPVRGKPPPENIEDLRSAWIERGKKLPIVDNLLIEILLDKSSMRRRVAALVVGRMAGAKALDSLERVFETDDPALHLSALESLRAIDSPKRIAVISRALKSSYEASDTKGNGVPTNKAIVRANIAILLSEIKEDSARELLKGLASREDDPYVLEILKKEGIRK